MAQRGTEFGKSGDAQATPAGDQPVIPEQRAASEPSTAPVRRGSVLGYLAEVEPLMEPTGGYPMIVRRQPTSASAPATPPQPPAAPPSRPTTVEEQPAAPARRRRLWPLIPVLVVVIVALAVLLLAVAHRQSTGSVNLPPPVGITAARIATAPTARYETTQTTGVLGLTGYRGRITVTNPGSLSVGGWTVSLVLPGGQTVTAAAGAEYRQDGATVTFTPTADTLTLPASGSVRFTFDVDALLGGAPVACAIDDQACA